MYLNFVEIPNKGRKTKVWAIKQVSELFPTIGSIRWYSAWRKYTFHPFVGTVWDSNCLKEVIKFLHDVNLQHKEGLKKRKEKE